MTTQIERRFDFSGGIQAATTWLLSKANEVDDAINGRFNQVIGGIVRRNGYTLKPGTIQANKRGLGFHESKWASGAKTLAAANDSGDTVTQLKIYDNGGGSWSTLTLPQIPLIPSMRSATTPSGTADASTFANSANQAYMAMDGIAAGDYSRWSTTSGTVTGWLRYDFGSGVSKIATSYSIIGVYFASEVNRAPKTWTFEGSNNGSSWTTLDTQTTVAAWTAGLQRTYTFSNTTAYRYYRLNITLNQGDANFLSVTDFQIYQTDTIDPNTRIQMADSIGETYIAGKSTSTNNRMQTLNVVSTPTVSATRSLYNAPKSRFITEYAGSLYAINVDINGIVYSDRAYKSSPATGAITFIQGLQTSILGTGLGEYYFKVDSVRYLKPGMTIDIYRAGTDTKLYTFTVLNVDKNASTFSVISPIITFTSGNVSTGSDTIAHGYGTATATTGFVTGQPFQFTTAGTLPTGVSASITYYMIRVDQDTIKVATSYQNAIQGNAIDLTAAGAGTSTISLAFEDNDELWATGRKGELSYFWNVDYPTAQAADYLRIPPGVDSDSEITAFGKGNNRLFLYTKNSTYKWDNANLVTVYEDDGCIAHETVQNIGDWIIWYTSEGRVRARNDATGQDEVISRPIESSILNAVPSANFTNACAGRINNVYKLCVGSVGGSVLRVVYDFDSNSWAHDQIPTNFVLQMRSDMDGKKQIFCLDDAGNMFTDDIGNTDNGATIPFILKLGRQNQSSEQLKNYHGVFIYAYGMKGASVKAALDGGDPRDVGSINAYVSKVPFSGIAKQFNGRDVNITIAINAEGDPPRLEGTAVYWNQEEDKFGKPT